MHVMREHMVTVTIAVIAILFVVGGFASMSGLSTYDELISIDVVKDSFSRGDVFDVSVGIGLMTVMADETLMIYIDDAPAGAVILKKYFDENRVRYGVDVRTVGTNSIEVISTLEPMRVNLADYVLLDSMASGSHLLKVEFSRGDAGAEAVFVVE